MYVDKKGTGRKHQLMQMQIMGSVNFVGHIMKDGAGWGHNMKSFLGKFHPYPSILNN